MKHLYEMQNKDVGRDFIIIGAGGTLKTHNNIVKKFINENNLLSIGINYMTEFYIPSYHLWTNKGRFRDFAYCISSKSTILIGSSMSSALVNKHYSGKYVIVDYVDKSGLKVEIKKGIIRGFFRTAGCLAIMIAYWLGSKRIYVAGMDGYTLYSQKELDDGHYGQHLYGLGHTDTASWDECVEKDRIVAEGLKKIAEYGVAFQIITPTVFSEYYCPDILGVDREV